MQKHGVNTHMRKSSLSRCRKICHPSHRSQSRNMEQMNDEQARRLMPGRFSADARCKTW